jgi:hypothetical protein
MATIIGYEGGLWLVAVLLTLALGLAWALVRATREGEPTAVRGRRPR